MSLGEGNETLDFIIFLGGSAAAWPLRARAQPPEQVRRIGYLSGGSEAAQAPLIAAFRQRMQGLGYAEGSGYLLDARYVDGTFERLPQLATDLLAAKQEVLLVQSTPANLAAKAATQIVPIVMVGVANPVGGGGSSTISRGRAVTSPALLTLGQNSPASGWRF